jgi:hypothetical protein
MYAETRAPEAVATQEPTPHAAPPFDAPAAPQLDPHRDPQRPGHATGPRTPEGKARSSRNALKHGLTSNEALIPEEDPAEFEASRQEFLAELRPAGATEETLAEVMVMANWKLRRVWRMEPEVFANWRAKAGPRTSAGAVWALDCMGDRALEKLSRYEARLVRAFHQSEARLRLLQKLRLAGLERPCRAGGRTEASGSTGGKNGKNAKRTPVGEWVPIGSTALERQITQISADELPAGNGAEGDAEASASTDGTNGKIAKRTPPAAGNHALSEAEAQALLDAMHVEPLPPHPIHGAPVRDELTLLVRDADGHYRELGRRVVSGR